MPSIYDFSTGDHATMLGDQTRLDAFYKAITQQVKEGMIVAEVGTGTGILSAFAATKTHSPIFAIEFYEASAFMAEKMMKAAKFDQVKIMRGKSYDLTITPEPDILITETIGALGPEENIVEICHDFKKRHPHVKSFIPSRLRVCAEPVISSTIVGWEQSYYDYFNSASFGAFDYKAIQPELEKSWCGQVRYDSLSSHTCKKNGETVILKEYVMGESEISNFSHTIDLSSVATPHLTANTTDAVHIYFEAVLDHDVVISTHYSKPETHWRHSFVSRPGESSAMGNRHLTISFQTGDPVVKALWSK